MKKLLMLAAILYLVAPALMANDIKKETTQAANQAGEALEETAQTTKEETKGAAETVKENLEYAGTKTKNAFEKFGDWFNDTIWRPIKKMFTGNKSQTATSAEAAGEQATQEATTNL